MSSVVEGKTCEQFKPSKESISYQPFYGKFATTGESRAASESENEESSSGKTESTHTKSPQHAGANAPVSPPSHPTAPRKGPKVRGTGGASVP
jgi:hypothetical protein